MWTSCHSGSPLLSRALMFWLKGPQGWRRLERVVLSCDRHIGARRHIEFHVDIFAGLVIIGIVGKSIRPAN